MGAVRNPAWYVVRSKPRAETFAEANLRSKAIEVFLPRLVQRFVGEAGRTVEPLFPGYLFAHLSLDTQFLVASWTPGVAHLLSGPDGRPAELDESVVDSLRERARDGDVLEARPALRTGDPVEIRSGPFAGLLAVIDRPRSGGGRIQILLEVLRRQTRVDLPASAVVPL
jgi:transcriptional antiterminator RfaH